MMRAPDVLQENGSTSTSLAAKAPGDHAMSPPNTALSTAPARTLTLNPEHGSPP